VEFSVERNKGNTEGGAFPADLVNPFTLIAVCRFIYDYFLNTLLMFALLVADIYQFEARFSAFKVELLSCTQ
jgi:hypothetical protein